MSRDHFPRQGVIALSEYLERERRRRLAGRPRRPGRRSKWARPMGLGPAMQVRVRKGAQAAVIELRPGLFVVAELREGAAEKVGDAKDVYDQIVDAVDKTVRSVKQWTSTKKKKKRRPKPKARKASPPRERPAEPPREPRALPPARPQEYDGRLGPSDARWLSDGTALAGCASCGCRHGGER